MNLGFYYHLGVAPTSEGLKVPSFLGVFLDAAARQLDRLTLFLHRAEGVAAEGCDYVLREPNIRWVDLGPRTPAWQRFLMPQATLEQIEQEVGGCDCLLVRAPSPLAPAFAGWSRGRVRLVYLVVGDYVEGVKYLRQPAWRRAPIVFLSLRNDRQLLKAAAAADLTLVNSQQLYRKYQDHVEQLHVVKTTTISEADFHFREDTCQGSEINLLYTGRIDLAKGLRELVEAVAALRRRGRPVHLHIVGWEDQPSRPVEKLLLALAAELGCADALTFHGRKSVGDELNKFYRMADMYVLPSYHEGFPRTIWEAMANSLPVIATRVGSIPTQLEDGRDALLIERHNASAVSDAIERLIDDGETRRTLIRNGRALAAESTLEAQTRRMLQLIGNGNGAVVHTNGK